MIQKQQPNKFNFFVETELHKGKDDTGKDIVWVDGIASSSSVKDSDKETLLVNGFNLKPLLETGVVNYNHQGSKDANAIVGITTEAKPVNNGKDLYVKCMLWPCSQTDGIVRTYENFKKYSPTRKVGFSIEGIATSRDIMDEKKILTADVTGLAITFSPKNKNTLMNIIKGEYSEAFIDDEADEENKKEVEEGNEEEKAITTDTIAPATPESVEHDPKDLSSNKIINKEFGRLLKKSEIYTIINNNYPTAPIAEVKKIYNLVIETSKKIFSMVTVTPESLQKAFDLLNEATALVKSKDGASSENQKLTPSSTTIGQTASGDGATSEDKKLTETSGIKKSGDDDADDDDMMKAKETAAFLNKAGFNKEQMCDTMTKGGIPLAVAQGAAESVIAEANAKKEGGDISQGSITKAQIEELSKKVENDINKSLQPVSLEMASVKEAITKGFEGFTTIITSLKESNEKLEKSNSELTERLEKVESTPGIRKSVTAAKALEKFEKGQDTTKIEGMEYININDKKDLRKLVDLIDAANDVIKKSGRDGDQLLEKAIESIEMAYTVPESVYPRLRAMNIILQK